MRRSVVIGKGIYQWEWRNDSIAVVKWDMPPTSTDQWVSICPDTRMPVTAKYDKFYLEGTCNDDIKVVPAIEDRP